MSEQGNAGAYFSDSFGEELERLLLWRRDVRRFRPDPVDAKLLRHLLELACLAPSVGLSQPWRFVEVSDRTAREKVRDSFKRCNTEALSGYGGEKAALYANLKLEGMSEAPVQLAVFADEATLKGSGLGSRTMPDTLRYSAVMAVHTLWLAARVHGLGMGWVSILDPEEVSVAVRTPGDWSFIAWLCIGWPRDEHPVPELERRGWEVRGRLDDFLFTC